MITTQEPVLVILKISQKDKAYLLKNNKFNKTIIMIILKMTLIKIMNKLLIKKKLKKKNNKTFVIMN